jgi:flagellar hook-associated protein 2
MTTTNIIKSLGASDIDTAELVTNLVNATKDPRQKLIDSEKKKAEVAISSTALIKSALSTLQSAATELGSASKLNKLSISSTNVSAVTATASASGIASPGTHEIVVSKLAQAQRTATNALAENFISSGTTLTFGRGGGTIGTITIAAGLTPSQIASAINSDPLAKTSGLKASLINTGADIPYRIVLESQTGENNQFSVTEVGQVLGFSDIETNTLSEAQDAELTINSIDIRRSTNTISDVVAGVSFQLNSASTSKTQVSVKSDTSALVDNVKRFVEAYNLVSEIVTTATGPAKEGDEIAGTLRTDSAARSIKAKLREKMTAESSSPSGTITHWTALGVEFDRNGVLQFDEAKFATKFSENAEDAVKALSNNASSPYIFSSQKSGLAGDIAVVAYGMTKATGLIETMNSGYEAKVQRVAQKQDDLDRYVERITAQYEKQFTALNSILASFKNTQSQLERSLNFDSND